MSFHVIIKMRTVQEIEKNDYVRLADTGGKDGGPEYGYVSHKIMQEVEQTLYEQTVERLDLQAVIAAVNSTSRRSHKKQELKTVLQGKDMLAHGRKP